MEPNSTGFKRLGLTLRTKMFLLSMVSFFAILIVVLLGTVLLNEVRINGASYKTIRNSKDALEKIALLKSDIYQLNGEVLEYMGEPDRNSANPLLMKIKDHTDDIDFKYDDVLGLIESKEKRESIIKAEAIWKDYKKTLLEEIIPSVQRGDYYKANNLLTGIQAQRFSSFSSTVATMVDNLRRDVVSIEKNVTSTTRSKIVFTSVITIVLIAVIAVISIIITNSVTTPLLRCVQFAKIVAAGELNSRLELTATGEVGELAHAMNTMAENLNSIATRLSSVTTELNGIDRNIEKAARQVVSATRIQEEAVSETSHAVDQINSSVSEISNGVDQLSDSASSTSSSILEMAASIEEVAINSEKLGESVDAVSSSVIEMAASIRQISGSIGSLLEASTTTASSISEMDATIKQVERNALDTAIISEMVKGDAANGLKTVQETISGMQEIRRSSRITAEVIETLSIRADDIGTILSVIDEVAEQTNLLALNAAIIAAQAGEHGKGFAVVADEIKELAERTSASTRKIGTVISGVQQETSRAVAAINEAEMAISHGEELSERSGEALEKIVNGVQRASLQISAIARATEEQARGSQSIREAMERVEEMVEHIATSTREHSKGSELITSAVERMRDMTNQVKSSTREQSRASSLIAKATEDVTAMIDQIRVAYSAQAEHSRIIDRTVGNIRKSSQASTQAAHVMDGAVNALSRQIDLLEKEMSGFRL